MFVDDQLTVFPAFFSEPSMAMLEPLFHSLQLVTSLLIIASHRPPAIPPTTQPAVRILRLRTPIAVEDTGATRLVSVLEWAEQTARQWRRTPGPRHQEMMEELSGSPSLKNQRSTGQLRYSIIDTPDTTPISSESHLPSTAHLRSAPRSHAPKNSHSARASMRRQSALPLPATNPEQRPFDAILNFIPPDISDKAVLKHAILVTTLTRPYLITVNTRAPATRFWSESARMPTSTGTSTTPGNKRWSLFRSAASTTSLNADVKSEIGGVRRDRTGSVSYQSMSNNSTVSSSRSIHALARCRNSRIVHLLPSTTKVTQALSLQAYMQTQARLIRSIEAFLLSFSFPVRAPGSSPLDPENARAKPYILPASALSDVLSFAPSLRADAGDENSATQSQWTMGELVLSGALDMHVFEDDALLSEVARGKKKDSGLTHDWMSHRAWIAGVNDIVVTATANPAVNAQPVINVQASTAQVRIPTRKPVSPRIDKRLPTPPSEASKGVYLTPNYSQSNRRHEAKTTHSHAQPIHSTSPHKSQPYTRQNVQNSSTFGLPTPPDSDEASAEGGISSSRHEAHSAIARLRVSSDPNPKRNTANPSSRRPRVSPDQFKQPNSPTLLRKSSRRESQLIQLLGSGSSSDLAHISEMTQQKKQQKWKFWKN